MLCHSVCSWRLPSRSLNRRLVATEKEAMGCPPWVERISGSRPRLPIRITLFTMFAVLRRPVSYAARHTARRAPAFSRIRTESLKLILQRVASASVEVGGETIAAIGAGLLVLAGVEAGDDAANVD